MSRVIMRSHSMFFVVIMINRKLDIGTGVAGGSGSIKFCQIF